MSSLSVMSRVHVPAGQYKIGTGNQSCTNSRRAVTLTRGFDIGTHCITNGQRKDTYRELASRGDTHVLMVTENIGRKAAVAWGSPKKLAQHVVSGELPVELLQVVPDEKELLRFIPEDCRRDNQPATSWLRHELIAFANFHGGRLPTEVEWEIAARTADDDARVFNYSTSTGQLMDGARKLANFGGGAPVDVDDSEFEPNRRGIWHMTGGVWEFTDTFWGDVNANDIDIVTMFGPNGLRNGPYSVVRGGFSDSDNKNFLLAAFRLDGYGSTGRGGYVGGRLAW